MKSTESPDNSMRKCIISLVAAALLAAGQPAARAHGGGASDLSGLSMLPVAVSVAAPVGTLVSGAAFTVVAVEAASGATVWVLERASDGALISVELGASAAAGMSLATGTVVTAALIGAGWVLSSAGRAICFIPNELGRALLHDERITR